MRWMYDSTSPNDIPRNAGMVAYYVDGRFAWPQSWLDLFPGAVKVSISAIGVRTAQVGDVEDGCIWPPANAVDWVLRARADGYDPTIYCNQSNDWIWTAAEFDHRGVPQPHWWVARYDEDPTIPPGAVAKQYMHPPQIGKHYDLSSVVDHWPGVDTQEVDRMDSNDGKVLFTAPDPDVLNEDDTVHKETWEFQWWLGAGVYRTGRIQADTADIRQAIAAVYLLADKKKMFGEVVWDTHNAALDTQEQVRHLVSVVESLTTAVASMDREIQGLKTGTGYTLDEIGDAAATATVNKFKEAGN